MSTNSARHALDWLDQNMHTSYPFSAAIGQRITSVDGRVLPSSFIVDLQLLVDNDCIGRPYALTSSDVREGFFMSGISKLPDALVVDIAYMGSDRVVHKVAQSSAIPLELDLANGATEAQLLAMRTFQLSPCGKTGQEALDNVSGSLVIGTCSDMKSLGTMVFDHDSAAILSPRVSLIDTGLRSVMVNGIRITSDFTLEAGTGVELSVSNGQDGSPVVTVDEVGNDNATYMSVDDVTAAVLSALGNPVRMINGIAPAKNGNFTISGGDCTDVLPSASDGGGVQISNKCARPCCGDVNKEQLETAMAALEEAQARLLSYYQSLSNNVNSVQARLSMLMLSR